MRVVYESSTSKTVVFAAEELKSYLQKMLGELPENDWEIRLIVDSGCFRGSRAQAQMNNQTDMMADSYRIQVGVDGGSIIGSNHRSILLAVYDYLHNLGCRFPLPQKEYEVIPHITKEQLSADYEKQASFHHRGVCIEGADSLENILDYVDWLPKVGFNSFFLQFKSPYVFLARWYGHFANPFAEAEPYTPKEAAQALVHIEQEVKKRGLLLHKAGHGWTGEVLGYQTLSWEVQEQKAQGQKAQKEKNTLQNRIALIQGKRQLFRGIPANTNLCYHNSDAVEEFVRLVVDYASENPQADYVHVWLADDYNNLCECDECRKTTLSDQYVDMLNEIDRRLTQIGLETRIVFLLYQELLWPPSVNRIQNSKRFVLMFAPISRTFEKSYDLAGPEAVIPAFERNHIALPVGLAENMAFLKGWQAVFAGDSFIYDYPLGRAHYGDFGYVHIARLIHTDIQKLKQMGLNGYISCQELRAAFPNALPDYVMGRTLFEKEVQAEDVIKEYFQACYGTEWKNVLDYLDGLSELECCDYVNGKGERYHVSLADRMEDADKHCLAFAKIIDRHRMADGKWESIYWEVLDYHRNYVILFSQALKQLALGEKKRADSEWEKMRDYICRNEIRYQPFLDVYRILDVTRNYTGFAGSNA